MRPAASTRIVCLALGVLAVGSAGAQNEPGAENISAKDLRGGLTFYAPFERDDLAAWHAAGDDEELAGGTKARRVEGKVGRGIVIPDKGSAAYYTRQNLSGLRATLAFWVKPDVELIKRTLAEKKDGGWWIRRFFETSWSRTGRVYVNFARGNPVRLYWYVWGAKGSAGKGDLKPAELTGWHHVVCQWEPGRTAMYLDGKLVEQKEARTGYRLGTRFSFRRAAGDTVFDELAVWNRTLSADEVAALHRLGARGRHLLDTPQPVEKPAPPDLPAAGTNVLRNSGFELGARGWELRYPTAPAGKMLDETDPAGGQYCLRIGPRPTTGRNGQSQHLAQGPYYLPAGQPLTLSVYLRSDRHDAQATLHLGQVGRPKGGTLRKTVELTKAWTRYELTDTPEGEGPALFYASIAFGGKGPGHWWADNLMLCAGEGGRDYAPRPGLRAGLSTARVSNIFQKDDPVRLQVYLRRGPNDGGDRRTLRLSLENFWDEEIWHRELTADVPAGRTVVRPVELPLRASGTFRAVLREGGHVLAELNLLRMPFTEAETNRLGQFLGAEMTANDFMCASCHALGLRWAVMVDTCGATLWKTVEPEKGTYVFPDDGDIAMFRKHGIEPIGWLDHAPKWAAAKPDVWKPVPARAHLGAWEAYVEAVVGHYRGQIDRWLMWDEMNIQTSQRGGSPELLYDMTRRAYRAAKKADPNALLLTPATSGSVGFVQKWIELGGLKTCDAFSIDLWSSNYETIARLAQLSRADGKARRFWDHGTGGSGRTFYRYIVTEPARQRRAPTYYEGAVLRAKEVIIRRAAGVDRMAHYWSVKKPAVPGHGGGNFHEFDGTIRPFAATFSLLGQFLYQYEPVGPVDLAPALRAFLFRRASDGAPLVALYAERSGFVTGPAREVRTLDLPPRIAGKPEGVFVRVDTRLAAGQAELRDLMLNPTDRAVLPGDRLRLWVGEEPVFLLGKRLSVEDFATALGVESLPTPAEKLQPEAKAKAEE